MCIGIPCPLQAINVSGCVPDGTCTFSKGDQMGISVQNSVDVSSNVLDQINVVVVVELDWTRELSANI